MTLLSPLFLLEREDPPDLCVVPGANTTSMSFLSNSDASRAKIADSSDRHPPFAPTLPSAILALARCSYISRMKALEKKERLERSE